ncbi:hypothetical protein BDBG_01093 [Blastomyces gilchristii SLH14081]|uniref:Pyridoxamine 5'-phosphate oxidase Alr4036 family FMN-binding domain-containing protein n=1 Tax=Blastomyces gilchristii (strain SLH14081) TaxID=559298 RepID=A0A179UDH9_BLAGS|nr:uncharacterized protein BDBG_01093 [Blastomyces gilchristii SLH14081]OAT04562.1 hypothetical protein BDBG_01093 [Blastomyces gilchristii SLH14081]
MRYSYGSHHIGPALNLSVPCTYTATYCELRKHHKRTNMVLQQHASSLLSRGPWRPFFQSHISMLASPEFSLATIYRDSNGSVYPRVRTCIFRGFWTELDLREEARKLLLEDEKGSKEGGLNPTVFESDLLTFTTDVRMEKVAQMESSYDGSDWGNRDRGGGPIEAVFWVKDAMTQWRIKGRSFIIGSDSRDAGELKSRENIRQWVRRREGSADDDVKRWTWEKEITANFANLSPTMRGSFKNPPPGTTRLESSNNHSLMLGQRVDDIHDPIARANFRVVVIVPEEVESVDLTSPENAKRMRWTLTRQIEKAEDCGEAGDGCNQGTWEVTELWP